MPRQPPNLVVAMSSDRGPIARVAVIVERLALTDTAHHLNGCLRRRGCSSGVRKPDFRDIQKGNEYPPLVVDVRVKYEQTVSDIRAAVGKKTGVPADKQQLFWHQKELTAAHDNKTLLEMHLHTGFSLKGYDLTEKPVYWPPVKQTDEGLVIDVSAYQ